MLRPILLAPLACAVFPLSLSAADPWNIVDVGPSKSWLNAAVNNRNVVAYGATAAYTPARWTLDGGTQLLGGGTYRYVFAINAAGNIAGTATATGSYTHHAALFTADAIVLLGELGSDIESTALGINDLNVVVGYSGSALAGTNRGFIWSEAEGIRALPTLGQSKGRGTAINNLGHVVGESPTATSTYAHAYWWSGNPAEDPIDLVPAIDSSTAAALNESDAVVGSHGSQSKRPFLWTPQSGRQDLAYLGVQSWAKSINESGVIAGYYYTNAGQYRACYWPTPDATPVDLNTLLPPASGWVLEYAYWINDHGVIAGGGKLHGDEHTFLLAPGLLALPALVLSADPLGCRCTWADTPGVVLQRSVDLQTWENVPASPLVDGGVASVELGNADFPAFWRLAPQ